MKDTKISTALTRLCNFSRCYAVGATSYEDVLGISSTNNPESLLEQLATAHLVLGKIQKFCSEPHLAMLKFRYGFSDHFGDEDSLMILAESAYPKNCEIGKCIVINWRSGTRIGAILAAAFGIHERTSRRLVSKAKEKLDNELLKFHSDLDLEIKSLLIEYGLYNKLAKPFALD